MLSLLWWSSGAVGGRCRVRTGFEEGRQMFERQGGLRQAGRDVDGPDMYAVFPRLESDVHACGQRAVADASGVIVEDLLVADLDEQRRQPAQVGEDRRTPGVGRIRVPEVVGGHGL